MMVLDQDGTHMFDFHIIYADDEVDNDGFFCIYADIGISKVLQVAKYKSIDFAREIIQLIAYANSKGCALFSIPEEIDVSNLKDEIFSRGKRTNDFTILTQGKDAMLKNPKLIFFDVETQSNQCSIYANFLIENGNDESFDIILGTYMDKHECLEHFNSMLDAYAEDKPLFILE